MASHQFASDPMSGCPRHRSLPTRTIQATSRTLRKTRNYLARARRCGHRTTGEATYPRIEDTQPDTPPPGGSLPPDRCPAPSLSAVHSRADCATSTPLRSGATPRGSVRPCPVLLPPSSRGSSSPVRAANETVFVLVVLTCPWPLRGPYRVNLRATRSVRRVARARQPVGLNVTHPGEIGIHRPKRGTRPAILW